MGRFVSPDSPGFARLSNPQAWNLYSYVENNPLSLRDPDGHDVACSWNISRCIEDANAATNANGRVVANTTVTHHTAFWGLFQWNSSVTKLAITGDEASFRALGQKDGGRGRNQTVNLSIKESNRPGGCLVAVRPAFRGGRCRFMARCKLGFCPAITGVLREMSYGVEQWRDALYRT